MKNERWVPVIGYDGKYSVSNLGRIKSEKRLVRAISKSGKEFFHVCHERILKTDKKKNGAGYQQVIFGDHACFFVHRLVAIHFCVNPYNNRTVNHIDGNKNNNCSINLEWVSYKENSRKAWKNGLYEKVRKVASQRWSGKNNPKYKHGRCCK